MSESSFDEFVDVVVVGSGGGALTGAYVAASRGLSTLVVESTDRFGGTSAYSGSGLWLPGNPILVEGGIEESGEEAREYLRAVVGDESAELQDAFIDGSAPMVAELRENALLQFEYRPFPDYFHEAPGYKPLGRDIFPLNIDRADAAEVVGTIRPTVPEERLGTPAPDVLTGGQALIARLLLACRATGNCDLRVSTEMRDLIVEDGAVVGVVVATADGPRRIGARGGVLIAAGGFEQNDAMRERFGVPGKAQWSMGAPGSTGRAIEAGHEAGGALDLMDQAWWSAGLLHPDGSATFTLGFRGGIFVNAAGERFMNESLPYDRAGREILAQEAASGGHLPFWHVFDDRFGDTVPATSTVPMLDKQDYVDAGLWRTADSLDDLAALIGVPADNLAASVEAFNDAADSGVDEAFHRGESGFDRFFAVGDGPNPVLVPIDKGPFHAVKFAVSDLGTKGGLVADTSARVLAESNGAPIPGLYAAGNSMASMSRLTYPGPGTPIGTCMVFSYLAVLDIAARLAAS